MQAAKKDPNENMVAAKQIRPSTFTLKLREPGKRKQAYSDDLAEDRYVEFNIYFDELKKAFPAAKEMWSVWKKYPYAKGGCLFIDEPWTEREVKDCLEKAKVLGQKGIRYAILKEGKELVNEVEGIT